MALVLLAACSRPRDGGQAATAAPTAATPGAAVIATPTAARILNPPVTPVSTPASLTRERAESLLRRIAIQPADVPEALVSRPAGFRDTEELAALDLDPAEARRRLDGFGHLLSYVAGFDRPAPAGSAPPNGQLASVDHTASAFSSEDGARRYLAAVAQTAPTVLHAQIAVHTDSPRVEPVDDLRLGDESVAWRGSGPSVDTLGVEHVAWLIAVRRGASVSLLPIEGIGIATDQFARSLARRLDERMAAAVP